MTPFQFGAQVSNFMKQAAGAGRAGKALGGMLGAAVKSAPASKAVRTATTVGGGAAAASQTPAGQNAINTASRVATAAPNVLNRGAAMLGQVPGRLNDASMRAAANVATRTPHSLQHAAHTYSEAMEPVEKTFPHIDKYTMPFEQAMHHVSHMGHGGHGAHASMAGDH